MIFITAKFQVKAEHADDWRAISAEFTAGGEHVQSEHFKAAQRALPQYLASTPQIVNFEVAGTDWSALGEMAVD